ncbi:unnamed protein product [Alopecurus aequalis]
MQQEELNSQQPPSGVMTDAEKERRYTRFYGEKVARLREVLESPHGAQVFGVRPEGYGLGILHQAMEEASRRKEMQEASRRKEKDPLEPEKEKIHADTEEEQGNSSSPMMIQEDEEQGGSSPPERERETIQMDIEQGSSPPPPLPSEQSKGLIFQIPGPCSASNLPSYYQDPDPEAPQYFDDMAEYYLEAAQRLPIAQMPRLAGFLSYGGLLLGLNDPVTNIIVNAIYLMGKFPNSDVLPHGADPARHAEDRASYVGIARKSRAALVFFMVFYFRHLTQAQAKRYLRVARHDLALAMGLVEWQRRGGIGTPSELLADLSSGCRRTQTAFRYAAEAAGEKDLVRLLASRFPCHLLDPVLDDLRRADQLSVGRVNGILNLLGHPWSPAPPLPAPTPGTFRDADGNVTIIANIGQDLFSTTIITRNRAAAFNSNKNGDLVTTTTISRHPTRQDDDDDLLPVAAYLSTGSDTAERRLHTLLSTTNALQLQPYTNSLKMCLIDTIHSLYIQALAMLPSDQQPRLLGAILAGGHCYGVMDDPVCNIVVNSIWYNGRFPQSESTDDDDDSLIKTIRSMTHVESSSLHGLIAILSADRGVTEQVAVKRLCNNRHNKTMTLTSCLNHHSLAAAAQAAKHPQPAALVAFLTSLTPEKLDRLRSLLMNKLVLSDADFTELNMMIPGKDNPTARVQRMTTPDLGQPALNTVPTFHPGIFGAVSPAVQSVAFHNPFQPCIFNTMPAAPLQTMAHCRGPPSYLRMKVEEVLLGYGSNNPLGPQYKLGVICGVASRICSAGYIGTTCYHVNFLASTRADVPNSDATSPPECKLYFAEFWNQPDDQFERSKRPPVCCPVQNYHAFPGRCFICESSTVWIVHPPCGNYFMGHQFSTDSLCAVAEQHAGLAQLDSDRGKDV